MTPGQFKVYSEYSVMPPIKKIIRDVIDAHHAHHAAHEGRASSGKARLKALLRGHRELSAPSGHSGHDGAEGGKRARALDGDDKEARRQAILDAAERLFAERHSLANVADVAEAAGLAKGTVYLYFQTKEEIYLALHSRAVEHFFTTLIDRLNDAAAFSFDDLRALVSEHLLDAPTYMPLGACCIGFAPNAVPLAAAMQYQQQLTAWIIAAGAGLERSFPGIAAGEGVRLLKHSYAMMIGMYTLMRGETNGDPKCPRIPGLGTYQQEALLALTRYWMQVAGTTDSNYPSQTKKV